METAQKLLSLDTRVSATVPERASSLSCSLNANADTGSVGVAELLTLVRYTAGIPVPCHSTHTRISKIFAQLKNYPLSTS